MSQIKYLLFIFVAVVAAVLGYFLFFTTNTNTEEYTVVTKTFEQSVQMTGRVQPSEDANLSFEKTGVIRAVYVNVGEVVKEGDVLATLSNEDVKAKVSEARANLFSQQALLEDLSTGSKLETVNSKQVAEDKAKADLLQAYKNAGDGLKNATIAGNNSVRDLLATSYSGNLGNGYRLNIASCDAIEENKVNILRAEAEYSLIEIEKLQQDYLLLSDNPQRQQDILHNVKNIQLKTVEEYLDTLKNLYSSQCLTINSIYDLARASISAARSAWATITTELSVKMNQIESSKTSLAIASNDLRISTSGEKSQKISQQEGSVRAAEAKLSQAQAEANKTVLRAPFSGVVTNIDLKTGEYISPGVGGIALISENNFEIESKVSEVDVAKLSTGARAKVHFDAYGDGVNFQAITTNISPAGIISDGVPTYKTIFTFIDKDDRIKSGMTANISVVTNTKEGSISVPAQYVETVDGKKQVKVKLSSGRVQATEVQTGGIGVDGFVEILRGLSEGDVIVSLLN